MIPLIDVINISNVKANKKGGKNNGIMAWAAMNIELFIEAFDLTLHNHILNITWDAFRGIMTSTWLYYI